MPEEKKTEDDDELTEEEIIKLAQAMKDNVPVQDEKQNLHTFLNAVVIANDTRKIGNLKEDKELNELGIPVHSVRGSLEMARIADKIMDNDFFKEFFLAEAEETLATSLSRNGFLIRQATTQTKAVADVTKRKKESKGMFGKKQEEKTGGDPYAE